MGEVRGSIPRSSIFCIFLFSSLSIRLAYVYLPSVDCSQSVHVAMPFSAQATHFYIVQSTPPQMPYLAVARSKNFSTATTLPMVRSEHSRTNISCQPLKTSGMTRGQ
ncbi:hypothetical protein BO83DRAFT_166287 [Aspergillus eucalypticola CBS 122712]|uniref:Uncharacterized protein n=1 Tax=Aspergillus eucalypticola (strain CBS 122712 / IBT 29274) TaxID=1448314 RepID=A0A317UPN0_ASPEC|nr:uncharacterized protein BO83DRAFT_166287 [Aspergillus eucalypticola CBS 122712]PWY63118.1 hypothetical protein BO83DRAFT_166287 [Aspergillus eucalypticola CBS 122712]